MENLAIDSGTIIIGAILLYFIIKHAVKKGVEEALNKEKGIGNGKN